MGRSSDVRERMVSAGEDLLAERGYAVTMLDVIARADAPRGSIYYHFPNGKEELALEVAGKLSSDLQIGIERVAAKNADPAQFLQRLVDGHRKRLVNSDYALGCPMMGIVAGGENGSPALDGAVAEVFATWISAIADALSAKGLSASSSRRLATMTVTGIEGCIVVARAMRSPQPFAEFNRLIPLLVSSALAD